MSSLLNAHASCDLTPNMALHFYGRQTEEIVSSFNASLLSTNPRFVFSQALIVKTRTWPSVHKLNLFSKNDTNLRLLTPHWKEPYQVLLIINIEVKCQGIGSWNLVFQLKRCHISTFWTSMHQKSFLRKPEAKADY